MTATVTLSIEIELGWGHHDLPPDRRQLLSPGRRSETVRLRSLLDQCDQHELPLTFGVVGHLLEDSCSGGHDGPHPSGWFAADPGTDVEKDPHFYAPDLIELIQGADVNHDIGTHTYSHVLCDEVDEVTVAWELERAAKLHREAGCEVPRSFVPPRHRGPPLSVFDDCGIEVVRRAAPNNGPELSKPGKFFHLLNRSLPLGDTKQRNGLTVTYCTPYPSLTAAHLPNGETDPHPVFGVVPRRIRQHCHERTLVDALNRAVADDADLHLWTHLYNLSNETQWPPVRSFLGRLADRRAAGEVEVVTMADLTSLDHSDRETKGPQNL